jgi:hypothetical protein
MLMQLEQLYDNKILAMKHMTECNLYSILQRQPYFMPKRTE